MAEIYMAPMEGLTTGIFRNVFAKYYTGVTKCFTPFLSPNQNKSFQKKELFELDRENNKGIPTVPQILCSVPEHFLWAAGYIQDMGYDEINLNLGCPSGTVVTKKKGSGFLYYPYDMMRFFDAVFPELDKMGMKFSIKTRLGKHDPEEFVKILDIYNDYPFSEIIIHPRIQKDFYREPVRREWFDYALENTDHKLCYNGDLFTAEDIKAFEDKYPNVKTVMLGRGLIGAPFIAEDRSDTPKDIRKLKAFHDELLERYYSATHDDFSVLSKLKENWEHMGPALKVNDKDLKAIRKAKLVTEYKQLTDRVFGELI